MFSVLCNNSDRTCFFNALTFARSLGRYWKPRPPASVFNTSQGTWKMLMHEKPCLIPIKIYRVTNEPHQAKTYLQAFEKCAFAQSDQDFSWYTFFILSVILKALIRLRGYIDRCDPSLSAYSQKNHPNRKWTQKQNANTHRLTYWYILPRSTTASKTLSQFTLNIGTPKFLTILVLKMI